MAARAHMTNQQMGQACPGWRGDLAACLVGALDLQADAAGRRHLGLFPACRTEFDDLATVVTQLARLNPSRRPRPGPMPVAGQASAAKVKRLKPFFLQKNFMGI